MTPFAWPIVTRSSPAVAGQQVERQAAIGPPPRLDRQSDVGQLVHQPAQCPGRRHQLLSGRRVGGVGFVADQRVRQTPTALVGVARLGGHQPVAAQRGALGAADPALAVDQCTVAVERQHRLRRQMQTHRRSAVGAAIRLEGREGVAHGTGEGAHESYGVTVQLLLVRHALPLRSEPGEGSDRGCPPKASRRPARLPDALARFPIHAGGEQPSACARSRPRSRSPTRWACLSRSTSGSPSTTATCRTTSRWSRSRPRTRAELQRLINGQLPSGVDEAAFLARVSAAVDDWWPGPPTTTPWRYSATAG